MLTWLGFLPRVLPYVTYATGVRQLHVMGANDELITALYPSLLAQRQALTCPTGVLNVPRQPAACR